MILVPSRGFLCASAGVPAQSSPSSDPDLEAAQALLQPDQTLFDMAKLEFDVTPTESGSLAWQFVFASEEYTYDTNTGQLQCADQHHHSDTDHHCIDMLIAGGKTFGRVACLPAVLRLSTPTYIMLLSCYARMSCQVQVVCSYC